MRQLPAAFIVLCCLCALLITACAGPRGTGLAEPVATDYATLDAASYATALRDLQRALPELDLTGDLEGRQYGPRRLLAVPGGWLLIARPSDGTLHFARLDAGGRLLGQERWSLPVQLRLAAIELTRHEDLDPLVVLRLAGDELPVSQLIVAPAGRGVVLLRSTDARGELANQHLSAVFDRVPVQRGRLTSADRVERLATTVALAQPDQAAVRAESSTRSHLQALAGGTDLWLAQAAAELLTLPLR